ncbi:MAG: hypothetical protein ABSG68_26920 [Thermoguttaceae bacterium]|jgi:hypothetical protein
MKATNETEVLREFERKLLRIVVLPPGTYSAEFIAAIAERLVGAGCGLLLRASRHTRPPLDEADQLGRVVFGAVCGVLGHYLKAHPDGAPEPAGLISINPSPRAPGPTDQCDQGGPGK